MVLPFTQTIALQLGDAQQRVLHTRQRLAAAGLAHRCPPPLPTTCCGRGCDGCVWDAWYGAVQYWQDQADQLLDRTLS